MTRPIISIAVLAFLAVALAIAATTDDNVPDEKYVEYGRGFSPYTARLRAPCGGKTCEATATLIADHWALTAKHVLEEDEGCTLTVGDKTWKIDRVVKHTEADLALLHCEESFGLDYYPTLSDGGETAGQVCSIAGYGMSGKMAAGFDTADGKLRAGTNHIERLDDKGMIICTASPGGSRYEVCIAPGDSGGPLFCGGKLSGVNSFTMAPKGPLKSRAGEESGHVRVSLYRGWIEEVTR